MNSSSFEQLSSPDIKVKYAFTKELLKLGKERPQELYPYLSQILTLLESDNNIIKWVGIDLLGLLIPVDKDHRIRHQLPQLYQKLNTGKMITANHAIGTLFEIAKRESDKQDEIIEQILKTQEYTYDTEECKNIIYGNIIKGAKTMYPFIIHEATKKELYDFIAGQTANSRSATKKKAEDFIKKYAQKE